MTRDLSGLAALLPHTVIPRCFKCHGRLILTITLYAHVPVEMVAFMGGGNVRSTGRIRETLADLRRQAIEDAGTDEREELHCERCDFWTTIGELESRAAGLEMAT